MIDFIKIKITNQTPEELVKKLIANSWDVKGKVDLETFEVKKYPIIAKYENLVINIYSENFIQFSGSLHKFFEKGTNENRFNYRDFFKCCNISL